MNIYDNKKIFQIKSDSDINIGDLVVLKGDKKQNFFLVLNCFKTLDIWKSKCYHMVDALNMINFTRVNLCQIDLVLLADNKTQHS
jgi:hypothetical protein